MLHELMKEIFKEDDLHLYLKEKGFETNYNKHENENGYDIIALKDGYSFLVEFKLLGLKDNGAYRMSGDIKGDILILATPKGRCFVSIKEGISLTKTARFMDML